jgi:WD40 repeat protein
LCAGQDRRGIIYELGNGAYERYDGSFLLYAGALSPSLKFGAYAFNEQNDIVLFDLASKSKVYTLKGQKSTLNTIVFASERELVSSSDDQFIMIWRLP